MSRSLGRWLALSLAATLVNGLASSPFGRRNFVQVAASSVVGLSLPPSSSAASITDASYFQQFPTLFDPLYGKAADRKTIKRQISRNVFVLEQSLVLGPLETPLRCTVIRLEDQSLWVHCPLAPTPEFFSLVESCCNDDQADKPCHVAHVVVPTYALEHKIFAKDALERWKDAKLWVSPGQFSFPLRSISEEFVWGRSVDGVLMDSDLATDYQQPPWTKEIEYQSLVAGTFSIGGIPTQLCETAFYHKETKCMIVTDSVARIPTQVPELSNPENLLLISKKSTSDPLPEDTPENRLIGWKKNCLLISFFFPEHEELDPNQFGIVTWTDGWENNFDQLSGRLLVPPVVRTLLYKQKPAKVKEWVEAVTTRWDFQSIIPAHWEAPIAATPTEFRDCFRFLDDDTVDPFPANDLKRGLKPLADAALKSLT